MDRPSSSSSAIQWLGSNKDERERLTRQEDTIAWALEAMERADMLEQAEKRIASESKKLALKKHRGLVLKKKKVVINVYEIRKKQRIAKWNLIPSTSTTVTPSTSKMESYTSTTMEPSTSKLESYTSTTMKPSTSRMESYTSTTVEPASKMESCTSTTMEPSTSKLESYTSTTMVPSTSTTMEPSTSTRVKLSTPIPKDFEWIRAVSTFEERQKVLVWARSKAAEIKHTDPDESNRLLLWTNFLFETIVEYPEPEAYKTFFGWTLCTLTKKAPYERKRLLKWAHSTAKVIAPNERKRWSLQEEILKLFETAQEHIQNLIIKSAVKYKHKHGKKYGSPFFPKHEDWYPHVNKEHIIYTFKGRPGLYECRNALWIWTKYSCFPGLPFSKLERGPIYFGEKIKDNFPESDMIKGRPSVNELGFVTIELSGKWMAESVHRMLKDGLYTWAPKLPVERVFVDRPPLVGRTNLDMARRIAIAYTLMSILEFSKVDALAIGGHYPMYFDAQFNRWFPFEEIGAVLINRQIPFILPKGESENAYKDIFALWNFPDSINVYITPVWHHAYIEMCLTAAELEKWIPIGGHKTARTSYAGYQTCNTAAVEDNLLDKARTRLGEAADFLGYSTEAILECVLKYTSLKDHRLAVCTFDINEMLNEEGNTFVYLLNTQAKLRRITDGYRKDINKVKKASELKLDKDKGWEKGEERILGFHLFEFTEALEESFLSAMPHILCEYVYDLSKKFNRYHSSVCKDGIVVETSTLLLYEATAMVMEQCFQLLGIIPTCGFFFSRCVAQLPLDLFSNVERPVNVNARDPHRNSRFQPFSLLTRPLTSERNRYSMLFGLISLSNKHGLLSDGESYFLEPDFAHVPLFDYDWRNPVITVDGELVYLGAPSVPLSSFSSFISVRMELFVTKKNLCYQFCNQNKVIDLSEFWGKKVDGECGCLSVAAKEGSTYIHYILLKDAVDTALEVKFKTTDALDRKVCGYVVAYYGDEFLLECQSGPTKDCYYALLFLSRPPYYIQASEIPLIKSQLAVPATGSLIVKAYLQDCNSREVIMNGSLKFKAQLEKFSTDTIHGSDGCSLNMKVEWNYQR